MEKSYDDKDVSVELAKSIVVSKKLLILPLGYLVSEKKLIYNEKWNKFTKLQSELKEENNNL